VISYRGGRSLRLRRPPDEITSSLMPSGSSKFIARLLDGEAMSEVCRTFGISRKTGYKIFERYKEHGLEA
jgi:hypothetical protein